MPGAVSALVIAVGNSDLRIFSEETFDDLRRSIEPRGGNEVITPEELFIDLHSALPKELIFERELPIRRV